MVCHSKNQIALVDDNGRIKELLFDDVDYARKPQLVKQILIHAIDNKWMTLDELFDFLDKNHFWAKHDKVFTKSFVFRFQMWNLLRQNK